MAQSPPTAAAAPRGDAPRIAVQERGFPIVVDGDLSEWDGATSVIRIDRREQIVDLGADDRAHWGGVEDLAAEFWIVHDASHLYVAGSVRDDGRVVADSGEDWHRADAVELFLDIADPATVEASAAFDADVFQLFLMPFNPQRSWGLLDYRDPPGTPRGASLVGIEVRFRALEDGGRAGYAFELRVPFQNFPSVRGRQEIGFGVAIDDFDPDRPGRYQYASWSGERLVDARDRLGRLRLTGPPPLTPDPPPAIGVVGWLLGGLPWVGLPLLGMLGICLVLWGWSALSRRWPTVGAVGRVVGVAMFVLGLWLPGWLVAERRADHAERLREVVQELQERVGQMRGSVLDSYRGSERDATLIRMLDGEGVRREQRYQYVAHSDLELDGPVIGAPVVGPGPLGFRVRPYELPLPRNEVQLFSFREPVPAGALNVVIGRPQSAGAEPIGPRFPFAGAVPFRPTAPPVVLAVTEYRSGSESSETRLPFVETDFKGYDMPEFHGLELSFATLELEQPIESLGLSCRDSDDVVLIGLTWLSAGADPEQEPLSLGVDTLVGVPTDLRGQYPRNAGFELFDQRRTAEFDLPEARLGGMRKLWLVYHGVYRKPLVEALGPGNRVAEVAIEFAEPGRDALVVGFDHQRSMFYAQDRYNQDLTGSAATRIAHRWTEADGESRIDLIREIDLPSGATPMRLRFRNLGPYGIRFRAIVFGREVDMIRSRPVDGPLLYGDEGVERFKPEILERFGGVEFGIFRSGQLSASTFDRELRPEWRALPDAARMTGPADEITVRSIGRGDSVEHEAYLRLRGEAWSDTILGAFVRDDAHGAFVMQVNRVGVALMISALPILLLLFSEILGVLKSLRIRLVSVLTIATLAPLFLLSLVLVRVLESDHVQRMDEAARDGVEAAMARLAEERDSMGASAATWLADLVDTVRQVQAKGADAEVARRTIQQRLRDQLPPAWSESGFLRLEFTPEPGPDGAPDREPLSMEVGGAEIAGLDVQLRTDPGVYLAWGVPLLGVRRSTQVEGLGDLALSVGRRIDAALPTGAARDRGTVLCAAANGYPVAVGAAPDGALDAAALARHAVNTGVTAERVRLAESLTLDPRPVVRRHPHERGSWVAGYQLITDQQGAPRLLLGVLREDVAATLPLGFGRVPVRAFFVGVTVLLLLAAVFLSLVVTSRISRPIEQLERGARALRDGRLDVRVVSEEGGQIGRLTRTFNEMADDLRGRIEDLRLLNRGIQDLTAHLALPDVLGSAVNFYARHLPGDAVRILFDDPGEELLSVAGGPQPGAVPRTAALAEALVRATGPFAMRLEGWRAGEVFGREVEHHRSLIGLPLLLAGRCRGVVALLFEAPEPQPVPIELAFGMAAQTAAALENARLFQNAVEDVQTGALRPEFFTSRLVAEVAQAQRGGGGVALGGIRVADGEAIAAALGPEAFGRILERIVAIVRDCCGADVRVCRAGDAALEILAPAHDRGRLAAALVDVVRRVQAAGLDVPERFGPLRCVTAVAAYPDDAASAEFLVDAVRARLHSVAADDSSLGRAAEIGSGIVLDSPAMRTVVRTIERVAPSDISVLLIGETGVGKEVLADLVHRWSRRAAGPLVKVHCAALPESLLQSELFGHEKGAFTGANERRIGRFEQAHGGTIFLDEIGEVSLEVQVQLLRVLQEREIDRVGGSAPVSVDVRVVAATNRDIRAMVAAGRFREDLYYRLQGMLIEVPPLRERKSEIPALVEAIRRQAVAEGQTRVRGLGPEAMDWLFRQDWPGNVRELRNTVLRALVLARGEIVERSDLLGLLGNEAVEPSGADRGETDGSHAPRPAPERETAASDREALVRTLLAARSEVATGEVAASLGVSERTALRVLQDGVVAGWVERVGKRRGARYRLANSNPPTDG